MLSHYIDNFVVSAVTGQNANTYFLWILCLRVIFFFLTGCCVHVVSRLPSFSFCKYCHSNTWSHLIFPPSWHDFILFTPLAAGWRHQRAPLCHRSRPQTEEMNKEYSGESGVTALRLLHRRVWRHRTGVQPLSFCTGSRTAPMCGVTFTCTPSVESADCVVEKPISCRHGLCLKIIPDYDEGHRRLRRLGRNFSQASLQMWQRRLASSERLQVEGMKMCLVWSPKILSKNWTCE